MNEKLARVRWRMGQSLLPEHFFAMEESLSCEASMRLGMGAFPSYGIARLSWDGRALGKGILSLWELSMVLPSGTLLSVPGNAELTSLDLNEAPAATCSVYLHRLAPLSPDKGSGQEEVGRVIHRLVLSAGLQVGNSAEFMKIGEFEKQLDGTWNLSPTFIPPLLQTGNSPFLMKELAELSSRIVLIREELTREIAAGYLAGENLFSTRQCLKEIYRAERLLKNLNKEIFPHPGQLFEALMSLYTEISFFRNTSPHLVEGIYSHDDLAGCLGKLIPILLNELHQSRTTPSYRELTLDNGFYQSTLPEEIRGADHVFLLLQRQTRDAAIPSASIKAAAISRLPMIHQLSLKGIGVQKTERPPLGSPFGQEVDYLRITPGREWDNSLSELTLGFYPESGFNMFRFFIYWLRE